MAKVKSQTQLKIKKGTMNGTHEIKTNLFFISNPNKFSQPRRSPPSLPHLIIEIKIEFLAHFYSTNVK
jgi:hypothetical protein